MGTFSEWFVGKAPGLIGGVVAPMIGAYWEGLGVQNIAAVSSMCLDMAQRDLGEFLEETDDRP